MKITVLLGVLSAIAIGCCLFPGPRPSGPPLPPPPPVPKHKLVEDLRVLWSYERNFAYRHKMLPASIGEMGDGSGIGKNGFVLKGALWEARLDTADAPRPASYQVVNPKTQQKESVGAYRFAIHSVLSDTGERDRFSSVLVSLPEKADANDVCFVALCGPVNLRNDFSFDRDWPVHELSAAPQVIDALRDLRPSTLAELERRMESGDLSPFHLRAFRGLAYPGEAL